MLLFNIFTLNINKERLARELAYHWRLDHYDDAGGGDLELVVGPRYIYSE